MEYSFRNIEARWQQYWQEQHTFEAANESDKPKYYALDMFPYPSGAGLHVGHPLGYIASDIVARYQRHRGYNVLHPMGYDSFGLPAEQYAIQTGQHPRLTTQQNLQRYRQQLDRMGFSFDWSREVRTSNPQYYRWTQWLFLQLFNSWYDTRQDCARPIEELRQHLAKAGTHHLPAAGSEVLQLSAREWQGLNEARQEAVLQNYRLAYRSQSTVNWCPALGTVLANDEVKEGRSERGGHPVEQKKMMQWSLRITAFAARLEEDLALLQWPESLKELQRNWIGRSQGASITFSVKGTAQHIEVFSTRPDTIFGATFMVLAPEHPLVESISPSSHLSAVQAYQKAAAAKSERERMADVKTVSGQFTGAYARHPLSDASLPIYIADYVLAGYGTGAVMAVPAHDSRDWRFARHFDLSIVEVVQGGDVAQEAFEGKTGTLRQSQFLNGLPVEEAIPRAINELEKVGAGQGTENFRLRDAVFGRQRYWGEPIPIYYVAGVPQPVKEEHLPLELPEVDAYLPTEDGEPPLARAHTWHYHPEVGLTSAEKGYPLETTTMPGWAGSSWYYLRYMDPHNARQPFGKKAERYWQNVDLYIGGSEHATGHLLYARFWHKFLHDRQMVSTPEPFQRMVNQGMILGNSAFIYRHKEKNIFIAYGAHEEHPCYPIHVDVNWLNPNDTLDVETLKKHREDAADAEFILYEGQLKVKREVEKMSKSKFNVLNPDDVIAEYGADTLRMYEMFLGPLEQSKPWNTKGLSGVHGFLKKLWRLYHAGGSFAVSENPPSPEMLKSLHTLIKKVNEDMATLSFNTSVSAFMIGVNELQKLQCNSREVLEILPVLLEPFAPHLAEELWHKLGNKSSVSQVPFPEHKEEYLQEKNHNYPVSFNGKMRFTHSMPLEWTKEQIEKEVLNLEKTKSYLGEAAPKKIIVVPGKIVNIVM